ncbi:efflux RND transporter periplasmic adaptor subunit [Acidicapsa acidisoli]|uniref:efflux RND transporter periplasmic adaptor subunit n=1 Tax=Acidicapsa acidisoli TaxID=1615681 RepID=UPI0021E03179|nr:efflux RND transporter periplasmic adaptor subunit [Acidicapsa acidisoli]
MKKVIGIILAVLVIAGLVSFMVWKAQSGYTSVLTGKVVRQDLATVVSGTGQIKPKTYVNVGATSFGRITHLEVKEGDHVTKGQVLARVENVQPEANVDAQQAMIASSKTDVASYIAAEATAKANVEHAQADLEQKRLDWERAQALYKGGIMAKQDFDAKKAAYDLAVATLSQCNAAVVQAKAQTESAKAKVTNNQATLRSNMDALDKTVSVAPFDGIVTNLPVREGETVVVGIQNAEGSTLMTLADMSVITAEVKVDETDIVNIQLGQPADVTVDALPGRVFKGHVTLVGDQAILRSTGVATSQSTTGTEEAKDFKVVITLDAPDKDLRPGLSTTAKITTARKSSILTLPIQALTNSVPEQLDTNGKVVLAASTTSSNNKPAAPVQGVYVLKTINGKLRSVFVPVKTGITGATDIEVLSGIQEGQEIVIGPFKTLRALKSGALLKRDVAKPTAVTPAS